jgi:hypothetical protein
MFLVGKDLRKRDLALALTALGSGNLCCQNSLLQLNFNDRVHEYLGGGCDLDAPDDVLVRDDSAGFSTTETPVPVVVEPTVDAVMA